MRFCRGSGVWREGGVFVLVVEYFVAPPPSPSHVAFHADASCPPLPCVPHNLQSCFCIFVVAFVSFSVSVPVPPRNERAPLTQQAFSHTQIDVMPASLAAQAATPCAAATWAEHVQRRYLPSSATSPSREGLPYSMTVCRLSDLFF